MTTTTVHITLRLLAKAQTRLDKAVARYGNGTPAVDIARSERDACLVVAGDGRSYAALGEAMGIGAAGARRRYLNATGVLTPKNPRS